MINRVHNRHRYRSIFYKFHTINKKLKLNHKKEKQFLWIKFPSVIHIEEKYRQETLSVIEQIKQSVLDGKKNIGLDFSGTNKIIAPGMIAIYAEIKNMLNVYPELKFYCKKRVTDKVRQVLTQIGIYNLCRQNNYSKKTTRRDVIYWRVCSGTGVIVDRINKVLSEEEKNCLSNIADIYGGCTEATKNALRHAYPTQRRGIPVDTEKTEWWCFSQVKEGELTILVCDLGVSIPATIPLTFPDIVNKLKHIGRNTDADIIKGALKNPRSISRESYRGNGLPKMMEVAKAGGKLTIYSRYGVVQAFDTSIYSKNYPQPLLGTIISLTLPIGDN